jgi:hypothetical protein
MSVLEDLAAQILPVNAVEDTGTPRMVMYLRGRLVHVPLLGMGLATDVGLADLEARVTTTEADILTGETALLATQADVLTNATNIATNASDIMDVLDIATAGMWTMYHLQYFVSSGTFVPEAECLFGWCTGWAGGGGGGGSAATGASQVSTSTGGNGGAKCELVWGPADFGAGVVYSVGDGGAGGVGFASGTAGQATTVGTAGALMNCAGGQGGGIGGAGSPSWSNPTNTSQATVGTIRGCTWPATPGYYVFGSTLLGSTAGQGPDWSGGRTTALNGNGQAGFGNTGGGGGASFNNQSQAAHNGGKGAAGYMFMTQYLHYS